ncbi:uncharacterized protein [Pyrus communis]|uniref:uncharacterized protein n=1 Tax=Pyrus communis TaxID=23211 RepID=UPI0035BFA7B6
MSIDEGIETQPLAFNLMEHDHIQQFTIPNNVEGIVDERQRITRSVQASRGINRPRWAPNGTKELMKFNEQGQPVEPPHTVARFSRFLGMLAQEASYFPINVVDWRHFYRASNMDRAWQRIKGTLDWTDGITLELEPKIRRVCEKKLNDRWKDYKANLKKEQANGSKPDRITFFTLTHTRKNGEPVDARSAAIIDEFNTNLKLYEDRNEIITDEVRHIVYANVLGPERDNRVRGFGTGVVWSDVPGIITEKRGICREVEAIKASYEEQRKAANFEIEKLKMEASEREERQRIEAANVVAQLRKEYAESMVAHNRQVELEVENMKREMRAEIMFALKRAADGGMVEPNHIDVPQVCVNRIEQGNGMEIQASGEVEDEGFVVVQNNGTDDELGYRPCMVNVTGFSK